MEEERSLEMSRVAKLYSQIEQTIRLEFRGWEHDLPHPGEKGGIRERRVADFLSGVLPRRLAIGSGHIVNKREDISDQTDIVIYDAIDGVALPIDRYYSLFPCESVYATIEVKSKLTASDGDCGPRGTVWECCENTTSIKRLRQVKAIFCAVLAYTTCWKDDPDRKVADWFFQLGSKYQKSISDLTFVLDPGFLVWCAGPTGYYDGGPHLTIHRKHPLLGFVSRLLHLQQDAQLRHPSLWLKYGKPLKGGLQQLRYTHQSETHPPSGR